MMAPLSLSERPNSSHSRREFLKTIALSPVAWYGMSCVNRMGGQKPPHVVIIFLDDSGWGDFPPFGHPEYVTPNVHRLAGEGCCFSQFYVPQAVCSASRASLLTGCYPGRTKVFSALPPEARGLDPGYATLAEILKSRGYQTAIFGKWHLGDQPETRPPARGFDESCGLMYSNDMWTHHPGNPEYWGQWPLRFWENGTVTIDPVTPNDQMMLTTWYTEHAVDFIRRNKNNPFFLYVPHSMPHVPLFCSEKFKGKSGLGLYADVLMEIDWSVGRIMEALKANSVDDNTIVIFTSDNGPWISYGNHAGTTPYREAKATSFDGGVRSACILKYPGKINAGSVSDKAFCSIDILPTLCRLTGAKLPANEIDGKNVWDLITGKTGSTNPHDYYAFSTDSRLEAVISGDGLWKLHLPHSYGTLVEAGRDGMPGKHRREEIGLSLFDMKNDPYETVNVIEQHPDISAKLLEFADRHKRKFYGGTS